MSPTQAPWRILIVDDSVDDAELTEITLRQGGIDATFQRVEREATLRDALATFAPHVVLCDVNLPGYAGTEAFDAVRTLAPDTRFVFMTGGLHPSITLPVADGMVLKDDLHVLPEMVSRLLTVG